MTLDDLLGQLEIPAIVAPMFLVSNPAMTLAACSEGMVGSFPAHGTRTRETFEAWLVEMREGMARLNDRDPAEGKVAPFAVNLVMHASNERLAGDLDLVVRHKVPLVLTSKSTPEGAVERIHDYGGIVLHDVASKRHAEKALAAGVDGLIAVAGGSGGHCGTLNPFSLVNEIRRMHSGAVALAGGMTTGRDVMAAEAMGADLAYIGTRFIATEESDAAPGHKRMILDSVATDVMLSSAIDGAPGNWLAPSLVAAGIDLEELKVTRPGRIQSNHEKKRWKDIWTAGHGIGNIDDVPSTAALCRRLKAEYRAAREGFGRRLAQGAAADERAA